MVGLGTSGTRVEGNFIGTDLTGSAALPNGRYGVRVAVGATNTQIGGTTATSGNLISGNARGGVSVTDTYTAGTRLLGNRIGTDRTGTAAVPNTAPACW